MDETKPFPTMLPCPFCGGEGVVSMDDGVPVFPWVTCRTCGADGPMVPSSERHVTIDEVANAWNQRWISGVN